MTLPESIIDPASHGPQPGRRRLLRQALAAGGGALLASCGGGGGADPSPGDATAPSLLSSEPAANATAVARGGPIELRFSEPVTVPPGAVTLFGPRGPIPVEVTVHGAGDTATLVLSRALGFGELHTVQLGPGIRDAAGNSLASTGIGFTTLPRNPVLSLGGIVMDSYVRRRWGPPGMGWNALPALADHGFEWLRAAVTTHSFAQLRTTAEWSTLGWRDEYWSCLECTGALMREAADLGMRLHAVLFLSDQAAHWGEQKLPAQWQGLDEAGLAGAVEDHARSVALYYQSLGLDIEVFELGNEIDAGAFGMILWDTITVPVGIDALNDPAWMRANLWSRVVPLLQAARRGVLSVYPQARIMLHVGGFGYSVDELAASAFFESMDALGMPFDLAGLSFPYMMFDQGLQQPFFSAPAFMAALDRIALLGRPIHLVEVGYNAKPEGTQVPDPHYPYTPQGQADFFRDLAGTIHGKVERLIAFYPDWYDGMSPDAPALEGIGMFSAPGVPRPVLDVFNAIAEGRVAGPSA